MIKLIATDMDGTFLDSSKRFSMEFFDIFAELRKKGIKFVRNSFYKGGKVVQFEMNCTTFCV